MYGLALKGEAGVEAIIKHLLSEFSINMGLSGYKNVQDVRCNMRDFIHVA